MNQAISTDDYVAIINHMGRYCWLVDDGDAEEWVKLWTEDGAFCGLGPEPLVGHEALKMIPRLSSGDNPGMMRHMLGNFHCHYGETRDVVLARFYNFVSDWTNGGAFKVMAVCEATIVRDGAGWKVKRNEARLLAA